MEKYAPTFRRRLVKSKEDKGEHHVENSHTHIHIYIHTRSQHAAVVGGGAEIGSLRANGSLLAAGTRDDALVSSLP